MRIDQHPKASGVTISEAILMVFLVAAAVVIFFPPQVGYQRESARLTKQVNNAGQIMKSCLLFAMDHGGRFSNGRYDSASEEIVDLPAAITAEACFADLFNAGSAQIEKIFWNPMQSTQCTPGSPDEDGQLTAGENCWDYVAGMETSAFPSLPLLFEASDNGLGKVWTRSAGHPWKDSLVVAYVDGSVTKVNLSKNGEAKVNRVGAKVNRVGAKVDLCVPTPGENRWPEGAVIAQATPHREDVSK